MLTVKVAELSVLVIVQLAAPPLLMATLVQFPGGGMTVPRILFPSASPVVV